MNDQGWQSAVSMRDAKGNSQRVTIRHVASAAGVSIATVSNVLNGRTSVAPELVARVRTVMGELGYQRDQVASTLRRRQTSVVGLVLPTLMSPFLAALATRLEGLAHAQGFQLLVGSANEDAEQELSRVQAMLAWRVAGMILAPVDKRFVSQSLIRDQGVKTVIVDRTSDHSDFDSVGVNNLEATLVATRRLIEVGHRRILAVGTSRSIPNMLERITGFETAAAAAGISSSCETLCPGGDLFSIGKALHRRLQQRPLPTAVFALSDVSTLAALQELGDRGLRMPEDVSLLGFDDHEWMQVLRPPISAVRQPTDELARHTWNRMMQRIQGDVSGASRIQLACSLEWRASTAAPPVEVPA
ncbi:MAG TPA: LacI family DNA-binding transcriptional regulator [Geminicoccus sp.]|uniref:LacI family DNA-binding transcriptional regulator n=1 Tax=Geminicoccus sp. TaxID=2024832 RepID=UPI002E33A7B2|nr:LacI family DNA-binding transcriptional regulator [Geminicoccus sp.]HEX2529672.1 LacI family DNA-binding transcriptional regulator [Geminicoccus sp.]